MGGGKSLKDLKKELADLKEQEKKKEVQGQINAIKRKTSPKHRVARKVGERLASGFDRAAREFGFS